MREDFLFDDDDPKQIGKGCDRLGSKKDGLKLKWMWLPDAKGYRGKPCQVSIATFNEFTLTAVFGHTEYSATLNYLGWAGHTLLDQNGFKSRIEAEKAAEQLVYDFNDKLQKLIVCLSK